MHFLNTVCLFFRPRCNRALRLENRVLSYCDFIANAINRSALTDTIIWKQTVIIELSLRDHKGSIKGLTAGLSRSCLLLEQWSDPSHLSGLPPPAFNTSTTLYCFWLFSWSSHVHSGLIYKNNLHLASYQNKVYQQKIYEWNQSCLCVQSPLVKSSMHTVWELVL